MSRTSGICAGESASASGKRAFLAAVAEIVGDKAVLTEPDDRAPFEADWRGIHSGTALAVISPKTTQEVACVVRLCARHRIALIVQGGNTSLCAGASPDSSGHQIILNLRRMRQLRSIDADNACMICEAGMPLAEAQDHAAEAGLLFPLSIASEGSATIGGTISTNAGGLNVLHYGTMRRLVLGVEAVLADGTIWSDLRQLRKDNTGYPISSLLAGAEGTLGIITAASLSLSPRPSGYTTVMVGLDDPAQAMEALRKVRQRTGEAVTAWELFNHVSAGILAEEPVCKTLPLARAHPWYLLGELSNFGSDAARGDDLIEALASVFDAMGLDDAVPAQSDAQRADLWGLREAITEAERACGTSLKHDVSVPISAIAGLAQDMTTACADLDPALRLNVFGHVGDGNLHVNVLPLERGKPIPSKLAQAVSRLIYDKTHAAGGSFSAEHGVGQTKLAEMTRYKDPAALVAMRRIKAALDPDNLLNPGRLLP